MGPEQIASKSLQFTLTPEFYDHVGKLYRNFSNGIKQGYSRGYNEPEIVKSMVGKIKSLYTSRESITLRTDAIYIHGVRSHVQFEYNGKRITKELGDIILMIFLSFTEGENILAR